MTTPAPKPPRRPRVTLARIAAVTRAGIAEGAAEVQVAPDGTIRIILGNGADESDAAYTNWRRKREAKSAGSA